MAYSKRKLRREVLALIKRQGFSLTKEKLVEQRSYSKQKIRAIHSLSRQERLAEERTFIQSWFPRISEYFASGREVDPQRIDPFPVLVENDEPLAALFRIARLWWSVPVSQGFG